MKRAGREIAVDQLRMMDFVHRGDMVVWPQAGAEPLTLTEILMRERAQIGGFRAGIGLGLSETTAPAHADFVEFVSYCGSGTNTALARAGLLDILPVPYSRFADALAPVDVLLLHLAPCDATGRYTLGLAEEYIAPLIASARTIIAQINDALPRIAGGQMLSRKDIDVLVPSSRAPLCLSPARAGTVETRIAGHVAALVEDRSVLQAGLGKLPETILAALADRRDLGVHSGALGDWLVTLTEAGALTNAAKARDTGVSVGGLLMGGEALYRFAHENTAIRLAPTSYTHDAGILAAHDRFVAVNSALEVDLTGQINAETAGGVYVGAVGGASEFLRGAHRSRGGLPVVALPATVAKTGAPRIVSALSGPVSTPRSEAGIIVTEHGVADLRGRTLKERRRLMLDIAAPEHRAALDRAAWNIPRSGGII